MGMIHGRTNALTELAVAVKTLNAAVLPYWCDNCMDNALLQIVTMH